jgi:small subunit ribosomal protein S10
MKNAIKIRMKSYDHRLLDESVKKIIEIAKAANAIVRGPIPLPTRKEIFTILRSPHIDKSSREQFERRTHNRAIYIENFSPEFKIALKRLSLPSGVQVLLRM